MGASEKRSISKEMIIHEALGLLKDEGLEGLTFRKLMSRLQIKAPAIYWRFENKRDLLDAVAEAILREHFRGLAPMRKQQSWQAWFKGTLHRLRDAMLAYPDGARLVAGARPHQAPTLARIAEYSLQATEDSVGLKNAGAIVFTALHYTFGHVIEEQASPGPEELASAAQTSILAEFPTIARLIDSSRLASLTPKNIYDIGLNLIIQGSEAATIRMRGKPGATSRKSSSTKRKLERQ